MIRLVVNNEVRECGSDPQTPLLWVLREELGLTGTKYSCGIGECGACTVLLEGEPVQSCGLTLEEAAGARVITIEGVAAGLAGEAGQRVLDAWAEEDVPQCGFCQPAQIITATALLSKEPNPGPEQVDDHMNGVLCRCGSYPAIKRALKKASGKGAGS